MMLYTILGIIVVGCTLALIVMYFARPLLALPHKEWWVIGFLAVAFVIYMAYLMLPITHVGDAYQSANPHPVSKAMVVQQQFEQY